MKIGPICETDEFISRFIHDLLYQKDFSGIVAWLQKIGNEYGALERYFRPERGKVKAIPIYTSKLRLYCIRISDQLLILGNGGIKASQKIQDSPDLFPSFRTMSIVEKIVKKRIEKGEIIVDGNNLYGNLFFNID